MIYATFSKVLVTRDYKIFCDRMNIGYGPHAKWRSPAECRMVAQFLLAVNTGRKAVFVNFNNGLAVVVEPFYPNTRNGRKMSDTFRRIGSSLDRNESFVEKRTLVANQWLDFSYNSDELSVGIARLLELNGGSSD